MLEISMKAPMMVEIQAPIVVIKGSLWVQGMIVMGPPSGPIMPVT
jgi:hypothetical protein